MKKTITQLAHDLRVAIQKNQISESLTLAGEIEHLATEIEARSEQMADKLNLMEIRNDRIKGILEE